MSTPATWAPFRRPVRWDKHSDLIRTQLQETGRIRLYFLTLEDLAAVVADLGIEPDSVFFRDGYAVVQPHNTHDEGTAQ